MSEKHYCVVCGREITFEEDSVIISGKWYHWECFQRLYNESTTNTYHQIFLRC